MAFVNLVALTLEIRPKVAAGVRAFIPIQAEPAQAIVDRGRGFLGVAGFVRVLDAQNKRAAVMAREKPVEERGARAADVQVTGRRRSKADANGVHRRTTLATDEHR